MLRRLLSYRHWNAVLRRVVRLLASPHIPAREKLIFVVPVVLYAVLPDAIPFLPIDDIAVAMIAMKLFVERMERKYKP